MPVVAVVDGIKVAFYANEHPPAHFHVLFAEHQAVVEISNLTIVAGALPAAKRRKYWRGRLRVRTLCARASGPHARMRKWSRSHEEAALPR